MKTKIHPDMKRLNAVAAVIFEKNGELPSCRWGTDQRRAWAIWMEEGGIPCAAFRKMDVATTVTEFPPASLEALEEQWGIYGRGPREQKQPIKPSVENSDRVYIAPTSAEREAGAAKWSKRMKESREASA